MKKIYKYNQQFGQKKLTASILSASVLFSMLAGCSNVEQYIRTNSSKSANQSTYSTESIVNTDLNPTINSSTTIPSENLTVSSTDETIITSEVPTETIEPYSDIKWEPIYEEGFSNYMLYNYDINLRDYILFYGFDSFLNENFTDYVNQKFNTNYEFVPFEITKTYFKYYLKQSLNIAEICDYDNDELYHSMYLSISINLDFQESYIYDYNVYIQLYKNNIPFGGIIPSDIFSPEHTTDQEIIYQLPEYNCLGYNVDYTQMNWNAGNYSLMLENLDPEKKSIIIDAMSAAFQEKGFEIYPVLDEYISYDFLIYRFPEHKEEIDEVTAQLQAELSNQEIYNITDPTSITYMPYESETIETYEYTETAETTRSH